MKKILIFSLAYYPKHVGGAEVAIKEITDRISPSDIEFHMVTNHFDSTLPKVSQEENVLVHRIGFTMKDPSMADLKRLPLHLNKVWFQFAAFWEARRLHKRYSYDGIWAMMAHSTGVPARTFKKMFPSVKYILTLQEGDPPEYIKHKMRLFGNRFKEAFTEADIIQSISTFLADWARSMGFDGVIEVIPNAALTGHFSKTYSHSELTAAKKELGKKEGDVFLVTTSRLVKKNAVDDVISALAILPDRIHFIIFGTGPDENALKKFAKEKGVEGRVHFRGHIDHKDMPLYLKACDIFIRPSRSEGMGNSFVEAMAAELPVIATQEGGIADFLFDAKRNPDKKSTGWAVDKDSPKQIAEVVQNIITHPDSVTETVKTAKRMVVEKYDWDLIAKDMKERVFDRVLKQG